MKDKKSFLLYCDLIHTVKKLPDDKAGELFKLILSYVNDEDPVVDDVLLEVAFEPIKQNLKRALVKWEGELEKKRKNGVLGNLKRWNKDLYDKVMSEGITFEEAVRIAEERKSSHPDSEGSETIAKIAVSDNVSDNVSVSVNDIDIKNNKTIVYSKEVHDCFDNCLVYFEDHLHPDNEKKKTAWLDSIDKLHRIDNIPYDYIEKITKAARQDDFWSKNFLSLPKLRKKNSDGIAYIVVFFEKFKKDGSKKTITNLAAEARSESDEY